jgi:predicted nucleotidyltransferase
VPDPSFESRVVDEDTFLGVLGETVQALRGREIPYVLIGGVASSILGRPRWTRDLDLFVRHEDALRTLDALTGAGFMTQRTDPFWLYKAIKHGVLVDVIFRSTGDIYLDDEMLARSRVEEFKGQRVRVLAPEDLLVIKAVVHDEKTPRHWYDALGIIGHADLDWDYLLRRARRAARRVLSLLLYAQSNDLLVPEEVIRELFEMISGPAPSRAESGLLPLPERRRSG